MTTNWQLNSSAFAVGATIPAKYTGDGADVSPPLTWTKPPTGTQVLALILDDPDAPSGQFTHWLVYDLPPTATSLPEGVEPNAQLPDEGGKQGTNDFGKVGYGGPAPPPGKAHQYRFTLYALDAASNLTGGAHRSELEQAMKGHVLAQTTLRGSYGR